MGGDDAVLCDGMLGHVTRWLRLLGLDAEYAGSDMDDAEVLRRAASSGRVLATRDVELADRARRAGQRVVLLRGGGLEDDLTALLGFSGVGVDASRWFTRCTNCNVGLEAVAEPPVTVPERVRATMKAFTKCPGCGHVYWPGTHVRDIERRLKAVTSRVVAGVGGPV